MKCEDVKNEISFIPRNELGFENRLDVFSHIQSCQQCRMEYIHYLRTFYIIDKAKVSPLKPDLFPDLATRIQSDINRLNHKKYSIKKWPLAATVLSIVIIISFLFIPFKESSIKEKNTLTQALKNEDWEKINMLLEKNGIEEFKDEAIPTDLIIKKLELYSSNSLTDPFNKLSPKIINDSRALLKKYHRYHKTVLVKDILKYYLKMEAAS